MKPQKNRVLAVITLVGLAFFIAACTRAPTAGPPVIHSFTASPATVAAGEKSTLAWEVSNATSVTITHGTNQQATKLGDLESLNVPHSIEVPHLETTTHTLTATNAQGSVTATTTVTVADPEGITIAISPELPSDIPGGAQAASLQDAAVFAWQEFIALNWPAVPQMGALGDREQADTSKRFGEPGSGLASPLVWQTFRHKVEIFSPAASGTVAPPPHGYVNDASLDFGYDALPQYIYLPGASGVGTADGTVPPCSAASAAVPWVNLDEQSEIFLDQMFAGAGPGEQFSGQQILFMAKANRAQYKYVAQNGWYQPGAAPVNQTKTFVQQNMSSPPPGSSDHVSFPNGTIELKSAWRPLTTEESTSGRFHTTTVRFYELAANELPCYQDAEWGLLALHIIQKTPTAPYFIYATFEQGDTILDENGNNVEDIYGNLIANQNANPLEPMVTSQNATSANPPTPSTIQQLSTDGPSSTPLSRLYYMNMNVPPEPPGLISINKRIHTIPEAVIDVNQAAQDAIAAYNEANGLSASPWQHYKLINVQYQPIDKPTPGEDYTGDDVATYYQANIVVETDYNLQVFSGQFQPNTYPSPDSPPPPITELVGVPTAGLITDFNIDGSPFKNVLYDNGGYNMGGCMGCHGNAQVAGSDFSFILLGGYFGGNTTPEVRGTESLNLEKFDLLLRTPPLP